MDCSSEDLFVLDIGTRSVMALLARMEGASLVVSHMLCKEHKTRAMLDGQIHHVDEVAQVIRELVLEMEELSGQELKKVAVAAAGRSLKTTRGAARMKFPFSSILDKNGVIALELQAVQKAQLELPKGQNSVPLSQQYYCVGYSIVELRLDGIALGSLIGQRGQEAEAEVVATFLPRIVVDSLQIAVEAAGLELSSITLEPIAVANLVLNPTMRRLNLVLVDIGAGTSDIAVCGGNTISAYGMVPMAGDEITEALSDHFLLDFGVAEEVKRLIEAQDEIRTVNVLGVDQCYSAEELKTVLAPAVDSLTVAIAQEIYQLNGKAPQALLLVGGGSLTPGLPKRLAAALEIPESRVAVQRAGKLQNVIGLPKEYTGPNFITVLGITYTTAVYPTLGFISVVINDRCVRLLDLAQNNVAEALMAGGYNLRDLYGRPGLALTCEINGQLYTLPGSPGKAGEIFLNDCPAEFGDRVKEGDKISFVPGCIGENASAVYRDLMENVLGNCTVNGQTVEINPLIRTADNIILSLDDPVTDGAKVVLETGLSVRDLVLKSGQLRDSDIIWVNQKKIDLLQLSLLKKNGEKTGPQTAIEPGDRVEIEYPHQLKAGDLMPKVKPLSTEVIVNGKNLHLNGARIWVNGSNADTETPIKAGDKLEYKLGSQNYRPILIDIFKEINFSSKPPKGKSRLLMLVNQEEKEYTYELKTGDKVELQWV